MGRSAIDLGRRSHFVTVDDGDVVSGAAFSALLAVGSITEVQW